MEIDDSEGERLSRESDNSVPKVERKVLDRGFVRLVEAMGDDLTAVRAARVSHGAGLKSPERDKALIMYLMEHKHETPFEHIVFTFHVKAPIFVARQWFRHRIGSFNEISQRYTEIKEEEFYLPLNLRVNVPEDRQKSVEVEDEQRLAKVRQMMSELFDRAYGMYRELIGEGIARELARIVLPLATYTQFYWTVNARSLMNFLNLRADSHAQWEIQRYAIAVAEFFQERCPWTFEAFRKFSYRGDLL